MHALHLKKVFYEICVLLLIRTGNKPSQYKNYMKIQRNAFFSAKFVFRVDSMDPWSDLFSNDHNLKSQEVAKLRW
jgi:hypothetical protein